MWGEPMIRINLGSGQRPFKGWTNVDVNPKWNPDVVADGAHMPMFEDGSVEVIVSHQNYEHYGLGEADAMVRECYRILRPGGSLIVTTPDLDALVRAWLAGKIDDYIFCVNLYGAYQDSEADRHKWLYTARTLDQALMKAAPWSFIKALDPWRDLPGADIARDWWILGLEAIK